MSGAQTVNFQLSVVDSEASSEELSAVVRAVAAELEGQGADVAAVAAPRCGGSGRVAKGGDSGGSILNVEINLENIVAFGKWLQGRLVGSSLKVGMKYGADGSDFQFDGSNPEQLEAAMDQFERYVALMEAARHQ